MLDFTSKNSILACELLKIVSCSFMVYVIACIFLLRILYFSLSFLFCTFLPNSFLCVCFCCLSLLQLFEKARFLNAVSCLRVLLPGVNLTAKESCGVWM